MAARGGGARAGGAPLDPPLKAIANANIFLPTMLVSVYASFEFSLGYAMLATLAKKGRTR